MSWAEGKARTNKLWCSECIEKINKGDDVIFELENGRMIDAYHEDCAPPEAGMHPYDPEALGQD